jgi:hypothetical protein
MQKTPKPESRVASADTEGRPRANPPRARIRWLRVLLTGLIVALAATPAAYHLALIVRPTLTPDGHRVMPIPHVAFALLVGPLLGLLAAVLVAFKRWR